MKYKIVDATDYNAVHSIGYHGESGKAIAQERIDSGACNKHGWLQKNGGYAYDTKFIVIPDEKPTK